MKATINVVKVESSALNSFRAAVNGQCHTLRAVHKSILSHETSIHSFLANRFFRTKHLSHFLRKIPLPPTHISWGGSTQCLYPPPMKEKIQRYKKSPKTQGHAAAELPKPNNSLAPPPNGKPSGGLYTNRFFHAKPRKTSITHF